MSTESYSQHTIMSVHPFQIHFTGFTIIKKNSELYIQNVYISVSLVKVESGTPKIYISLTQSHLKFTVQMREKPRTKRTKFQHFDVKNTQIPKL